MLLSLMAAQAMGQSFTEGKTVYPVGGTFLTWTNPNNAEQTYTANAENLNLLTQPGNTQNVYLLPEIGLGDDAALQAFYVDMEAERDIKTVSMTWEGATAKAYTIYVTNEAPTSTDIPGGLQVIAQDNLGQTSENTENFATAQTGRYLVFVPTAAFNPGWGVKMRTISAYAESANLASISLAKKFIDNKDDIAATGYNEFGVTIDTDGISYNVNGTALADWTLTPGVHTLTATKGSNSATATFAVLSESDAPQTPDGPDYEAFYTSTTTNAWQLGWNGGATADNELTLGTLPVRSFTNTNCVFITSDLVDETVEPNNVNWNINPASRQWVALYLNVYSAEAGNTFNVKFKDSDAGDDFVLSQGWNNLKVDLSKYSLLSNMQLRAGGADVAIANIYFEKGEQDAEAGNIASLTVSPSIVAVGAPTELTLTAENNKGVAIAEGVTYTADGLEGTTLTASAPGAITVTGSTNGGAQTATATVVAVETPAVSQPENAIVVWNGNVAESKVGNDFTVGQDWEGGFTALPNVAFADGTEAIHAANVSTLYIPSSGLTADDLAGYNTLKATIYSTADIPAVVLLEEGNMNAVVNGTPVAVNAGEWTEISMTFEGEEAKAANWIKVKMMDESLENYVNNNEILVTNIYYTKATATGINNIAAETTAKGDLYNVAGQKVNANYKGIVIKNGKKYIK